MGHKFTLLELLSSLDTHLGQEDGVPSLWDDRLKLNVKLMIYLNQEHINLWSKKWGTHNLSAKLWNKVLPPVKTILLESIIVSIRLERIENICLFASLLTNSKQNTSHRAQGADEDGKN